ncbi:hypothetical protein AMECASPLE_033733 [Ameca splendens]|uniref:Uncharacterized protein n=1 Tax=Ameca splendens TaxID=208324 RepID=A0ABV0Y6W6_9TELE
MRAHDQHAQPPPNPRGTANKAPSPRCPAPDRSHNQASRATKHIPLQHRGRHQAALMTNHPAHYHAQGKRHRPSKPKGATERPQHMQQGGHTPIQRRRPTNIQVSQAKTIEPSQTADCPEPAPQEHHTPFCAFVGARRRPLTPSTHNPPGTIQQTSKPHPSTRPRSLTQAQSPATDALPYHARRSEPPRTGPPPQHHSSPYSGGRNAAKSTRTKTCTQYSHCANAPHQPPAKVHPHEKKTRSIQVLEHDRHPYTHPEAHKRQESPHS